MAGVAKWFGKRLEAVSPLFSGSECCSAFRTEDPGTADATNLGWLNRVAALLAVRDDRGSHFVDVDFSALRHQEFIIAHSRGRRISG